MTGFSFHDRRRLDEVELRELREEELVALRRNASLRVLGSAAVLRVQHVDDVHAFDDLAERNKALGVEEGVVLVVDEDLRAAAVGTARGAVGDERALVALLVG